MYLKGVIILVLTVLYIALRTPSPGITGSLSLVVICAGLYYCWDNTPIAHFVPQWVKRILKPLLGVLAVLSAFIFILFQFVSSYAGEPYNDNAWDRMALRRIAHSFDLVPAEATAPPEDSLLIPKSAVWKCAFPVPRSRSRGIRFVAGGNRSPHWIHSSLPNKPRPGRNSEKRVRARAKPFSNLRGLSI
jgi:hypothetical protein